MSISVQEYRNLTNLAKYATATAINQTDSPMTAVKEAGGFAAFSGVAWGLKNRKNLKGAWQAVKASDIEAKAIMQRATQSGKTIKNIWNGAKEITAKAELETIAAGNKATASAAQAALQTGGNYNTALNAINTSTKTGFLSKIGKCFKGGGGIMAACDFVGSCITDVIPAFQIGTKEGFKQVGKSATKAAAVGVGWWAGSALGAKAGAAIGTACCPGIGTAVGAVVGFIGGCLGSWLCGKAASKIVGKTEVEKVQEEQAKELADEAAFNGKEYTVEDVAKAAYEKLIINVAANDGKMTDDDKTAQKSLEALIGEEIDIDAAVAEYNKQQAQEQAAASGAVAAPTVIPTDAKQEVTAQGISEKEDKDNTTEKTQKKKKRETLADLYKGMNTYSLNTMPIYTNSSMINPFSMAMPQLNNMSSFNSYVA